MGIHVKWVEKELAIPIIMNTILIIYASFNRISFSKEILFLAREN